MLFKIVSSQESIKKKPETELMMNKTWTTGTRAWAAAEQINTTKAVKCSEWRGRVSGHGFSSENSSSGKKCQLHPHYREREEGSPWGMYSHNHRGLQTNHQLLGESGFLFVFFNQCQPLIKWKFEFQRYIKSSYFKLTMRNGSMHSYQAG